MSHHSREAFPYFITTYYPSTNIIKRIFHAIYNYKCAATTFLMPLSSERLIIDFSRIFYREILLSLYENFVFTCNAMSSLSMMRRRNVKKGTSSSSSFRLFTSERHFYNFLLFFASLLFRRLFLLEKRDLNF